MLSDTLSLSLYYTFDSHDFVISETWQIDDEWVIDDKVLQIIGIGESVEIKCKVTTVWDEAAWAVTITGDSRVFAKNICCIGVDSIDILDNSTLWMDGCELRQSLSSIRVAEKGNIHVKSCKFSGTGSADPAISIENDGEQQCLANIIGCRFGTFSPCIESTVPVRCIGCIFGQNLGSVVCIDKAKRQQFLDQSVFKGNVFESTILDICTM